MNTPATPENNWTWRMAPDALNGQQAHGLAQLAELTDRDGWVEPAEGLRTDRSCRSYASIKGGRCIQLRPVQAELQSRGYKLIIIQRLDDVAVGEMIVCAQPIFLLAGGSENDDRQMLGAFIRANRRENCPTR